MSALVACSDDDDDRASGLERQGSEEASGDVSVGDVPEAYAVTYRVTDGRAVSTERVVVRRPFSSRVEVEASGDVVARRVSRFATLVVEGNDAVSVLTVPPSLGTGDVRPDVVLDDAISAGAIDAREVREVAGRRCQVYRFGSSASDGSIVPVGTTDGEHADVCIDRNGLVLEEWWVRDGLPLRQRIATKVEIGGDAGATDDRFALRGEDAAIEAATDGSIAPSEAPIPMTVEPPTGFTRQGRYALTAAQIDRTSVVEVWTDDIDFVALDFGVTDVAPHPHADQVDLGALGNGELILDLRANEIRAALGELTVRVYGTLPADDLLAVARSLTPS